MQIDSWLTESAIVIATLAILGAYHWRLWRAIRLSPTTTATGRHRIVRAAWAEMVQRTRQEILVVQTLRNWIVSATFLASTAILLTLGLLGVAFTTDKMSQVAQGLNYLGSQDTQLLLVKALLLVVNFLAAFFNFSLAIRAFIHAGFEINLMSEEKTALGRGLGAAELERGALHYTLGMRGYYLAIPLALWLFGPTWMLLGALLLVLILHHVD